MFPRDALRATVSSPAVSVFSTSTPQPPGMAPRPERPTGTSAADLSDPQFHTPYYDYVFIERIELVSGAVDDRLAASEEWERTTR